MGTLRLLLSLLGLLLFAGCAVLLVLGFIAKAFSMEELAWAESPLAPWLFGALLVVLAVRYLVIRVQRSGMLEE
jgi:hypothetical protein